MFRLTKPSVEDCTTLLALAAGHDLTYPEVGATRAGALPSGYRHDRHSLRIGPASLLESAAEQLMRWQAQIGAGAQVVPDDPITTEGSDHLVLIRLSLVWTVVPVRIVYLIDEPDRKGFGYGTLPDHPETGEESFVVERQGVDSIFRITAFSKPSGWLVRLGRPVARTIQSRTTARYLEALKHRT